MKITGWKIATFAVLLAALTFHFSRQPSSTEANVEDLIQIRRTQQQQAVKLISLIRSANQRMNSSGSRFGEAVQDAMDAETVDPKPLLDAHAATLAEIRKTRSEFQKTEVLDSRSGKALNKAYAEYLNWQEKIYAEDYADLVNALVDPESTSLERHNVAFAVIRERSQDERKMNTKLSALQDALRNEHRVKPN